MDMDDETGMADLRQYMNRRPFFPPISPTTDLLSGHHPGLTQPQQCDMFIIPQHGLQPAFRSDSTSNTNAVGGGSSSSAVCFDGFETEAGGLNSFGDGGTRRWPRQETLTLLEIRSRLDTKFKEANQKGPLWDEVSRIMSEEHGYQRSGRKCREKFENLYKYYKKTKEGTAGRPDGKHYRLFRQLEALYGEISNIVPVSETHIAGSTFRDNISISNILTPNQQELYQHSPKISDTSLTLSNSSNFDTTSSDGGDVNGRIHEDWSGNRQKKRGNRRWKGKIKDFIDEQMRKLMDKQEAWMEKMMRTIEDKEQERMIREEEWRKQDAERIEKEHNFWARESACIEARYAALMETIRNIAGKELEASPSDELMEVETQRINENQKNDEEGDMIWPEWELTRLIQLRNNLDPRFQQDGFSEDELWEEIATKMACFGYQRSALVSKEKWDSVNNYVIKCSKKREYQKPYCCYYQNNESICINHSGALCDNTSGLGPEVSPSNSNTGNAMNDSCFRYFTWDDHNTWENFGLKLNKIG